MPISHVGFISINVHDLDRAIRFYTEHLGFAKTTDAQMGPGARWVELTPPGGNTRVTLLSEGNPAFERDRIGKGIAAPLEVSDFEATCAALEKKGVRFKSAPKRQPWGWWAEVLDSEDNVLGLHGDA
jgi:predicted enzyme related to lactoylglutathione lyase